MKKLYFLFVVFLAAIFLTASSYSDAQANPNWVKTSWNWKIERNNNPENKYAKDAYMIRVNITHVNKSNDKIITAFF